jgi:histidinol-phosphate/aromatic aminotransferase/cobyric acid decarboxylase-like protein
VSHGGVHERNLLDFSATVNPERPEGVSRVYETALCAARSYPRDDYCEFRVAAGEHLDVEPADVVPTAGGLEAVRLATSVAVDAGDRALVPSPAVDEYARNVRQQGGEPELVPEAELLERDPEGYALAVVCNPSDPTGRLHETDDLLRFAERCRAAGTVLVVDEAFHAYTDRASLAGQPGVVVTRAPAQLFGLPGLWFGFAVATGDLRDRLAAGRRTWTLSTPAADVGTYCLRQPGFVERTRERVREGRARLAEALAGAYDVHPSDSPFLLLDVRGRDPAAVAERARERGVVVRDATTFEGLDNQVRVSVRRPPENDHLLYALGVRDPP